MSMRVFYAYLFKEDARFEDLAEVQTYLNDLKVEFLKWVPEHMLKWPIAEKVTETYERIKRLEKDTKSMENGGVWDYQLTCTVYCKTVEGKNYIALQFFPSSWGNQFLKEHVKLREFWYENQTDEGFDLPDYELREKFWKAVFDKYWYPSEAGLDFTFYDGTNWSTSHKIIANLEKLEKSRKETKDE